MFLRSNESVFRDAKPANLAKSKRAQELRVDEFSVQKLRESGETIQKLTSKVQELQKKRKMNLNDSGEVHEVESNYCGKVSHVPSQPARIASPRSMQSCDKRLQPETWNPPGLQENVLANPRSTLESSQIPYRGIHPFVSPNAAGQVLVLISTGAPVAREEERIGSTIPMPTIARRPPTMSKRQQASGS